MAQKYQHCQPLTLNTKYKHRLLQSSPACKKKSYRHYITPEHMAMPALPPLKLKQKTELEKNMHH